MDISSVKITSMEHWYDIRQKLIIMSTQHPRHHKDFHRVIAAIEVPMAQSSELMLQIRRKDSANLRLRYEEKLEEANQILELLQQNLLLLLLSKT